MRRPTKTSSGLVARGLNRLKRTVKDHFVPHPGNNHTPHVLHHRALFGYSVILVLLKVLVLSVSITLPAHSLLSSAITPSNIINLTNETRRALNLSELQTDDKLMAAAQAKAEDMFANHYFAHTSPTGVTPWYWFKEYGYDYRSAGENLAAHFTEAEDVEAGWMASPTHRDNIVSNRYAEIGVGVAQGVYDNYQTTFVVQMFGYELNENYAVAELEPTPVEPKPAPADVAEPTPEPVAIAPAPDTIPADTTPVFEPVADSPSPGDDTAVLADVVVDDEALAIDASSLVLRPIENGYAVEIHMDNVSEAVLYLGSDYVPFTPTSEAGVWQTVVTYNPLTMSADGEKLYMVAGGWDGEQKIEDLAWIMPNTSAPEVYAFQGGEAPKLLGVMDIADLDDGVQKFYIITLLFLGGALLISVFVKVQVQKPTIIAHSLMVLVLAVVLAVI